MSDVENSVENSAATVPGNNGGRLLPGGKKGNRGGGRPKDKVREACALAFESRIAVLEAIADGTVEGATVKERLSAMDLLGKYGGLQKIETESHDGTLEDLMREAAASDGDGQPS